MKKPYYNIYERRLVYSETLTGDLLMLRLSILKFSRALKIAIFEVLKR